ncbi:MAG: polysaccharide biosynthesis protein [Candidatus Atribacteria bacterium]|nr:polysaccharide biosynthesis protein [Candidatus Atribacteria bacterium]
MMSSSFFRSAAGHFLIDVVSFVLAIVFAFFFRFEFHLPQVYARVIPWVILREAPLFLIFYFLFRIHQSLWEYFSLDALRDLVLVITLEKLAFSFLYFVFPFLSFPRSVVIISYTTTLLLLFFVRVVFRWWHEKEKRVESARISTRPKRVLIVGAGDAGEKILREIKTHPELGYEVVGLLDDDRHKRGKVIHGTGILGSIEDLPRMVRDFNVHEVLIAIPSAKPSLFKRIVTLASSAKVPLRTLPGIWELINGTVSVSKLRRVRLEDLLEREVVNLDSIAIREYLAGRVVLVTGAGGSIGSEICRQVATYRPGKLLLLGRGENSIFNIELELKWKYPELSLRSYIADVRDRERIFSIFAREKPEVVFHAAAHKHVPLMEENPYEAVTNNIFGTVNVIEASRTHGTAKFIFISTDKAVYPANIMGATKRIGEILLRYYEDHSSTQLIGVRFGNVLGSRGSVVEVFRKQLEEGLPLTITHPEMERFFMTIEEAVGLVLQAGALGRSGDLFVLDMGKPIRVLDLARNFIELSGYTLDEVEIQFVGVRSGERIREDLWEKEEKVEKTAHPKILRILSQGAVDGTFFRELETLRERVKADNPSECLALLQDIIARFGIPKRK